MTVSGDLQNAGTVDVGSGNTVGTLNVTGTLTNQSSLLVSATANLGTLANSGNTTISGRLNAGHIVNDSSLVIASGGIVNARNVINNSSLILNIGGAVDSTTFTNARGGTLTLYGFSPSGSPGSQPGGVLNTMVFTSSGATLLGFPAAPGIGAIIAIGSGSVPGGTIGYYQFGNGTLAELIYGTPGGNDTCTGSKDCGIIEVASPVHLDGRLDPILANGFDPTDGESFIFLTAGSLAGRFSSMENMEFNNDTQYWVVSYGSDYVKLTAEPVPEPATLLLFGAGLAALGTAAWFERRNKHSR
jgi:hypothetical protein